MSDPAGWPVLTAAAGEGGVEVVLSTVDEVACEEEPALAGGPVLAAAAGAGVVEVDMGGERFLHRLLSDLLEIGATATGSGTARGRIA